MDRDNVSKPHAQIRAHNLVHPDLVLVSIIFSEDNADGVLALLALQSKPDRSERKTTWKYAHQQDRMIGRCSGRRIFVKTRIG